MSHELTVVVPVWQDDDALAVLLELIKPWPAKVIVVDGASAASTQAIVRSVGEAATTYLPSSPSRGRQISVGIGYAKTPWVWVLHADTKPTLAALGYIQDLIKQGLPRWGRFDVDLPGLEWIGFFMNWRSRWSKICTGDQAMFFHAQLLVDVGGYPQQPLMEDIEVSKRLKKKYPSEFRASNVRVESSPRRWRSHGVMRTVRSMWSFRLRYYLGASPEELAKQYYGLKR